MEILDSGIFRFSWRCLLISNRISSVIQHVILSIECIIISGMEWLKYKADRLKNRSILEDKEYCVEGVQRNMRFGTNAFEHGREVYVKSLILCHSLQYLIKNPILWLEQIRYILSVCVLSMQYINEQSLCTQLLWTIDFRYSFLRKPEKTSIVPGFLGCGAPRLI